jgi:hypothetical protein
VRELIANSQSESNFRAILKALTDMIKLSGRISLMELVFPLFREDLPDKWKRDLVAFVEGFLKENPVTLPSLRWVMEQVADQGLDNAPGENVRIGLARKLLLPMVETCNVHVLAEFACAFGKHLETEVFNLRRTDDTWDSVVLWI